MPPDVDPLSKALEPPPDESPEERTARIQAEADAKRVSDMIDEQLESERAAVKKGPKALKVLLLGQGESGKSTTLKNFQMMYEPKAFKKERAAWKAVIQLNVVRSIHLILDALTRAQAEARNSSSSSSRNAPPQISQELLKLQRRLAPLLQVEQALIRRLAPVGAGEAEKTLSNPNSSYADRSKNMVKEIVINSGYGSGWRSALTRFLGGDGQESRDTEPPVDWNDPNDPGVVLSACKQDMVTLWADPAVRAVLYRQKLRLEDMAGFFLDCIERVTAVDYVPSDDDVLRARLKTVGISEHRFSISSAHGGGIARDWRIYDVGGHRSLRAAWVPYFDDMDAIIFLAPISAFDQKLAEDPDINRLEDSVNLWNYVVSNKLLKNTNIILFLNKTDIMHAKLSSGIKFVDFVLSYGTRPNDLENTSQYLRKKFGAVMKEKSIVPRPFYCHFTSVVDSEATKRILSDVKDVVMRKNLAEAALIS